MMWRLKELNPRIYLLLLCHVLYLRSPMVSASQRDGIQNQNSEVSHFAEESMNNQQNSKKGSEIEGKRQLYDELGYHHHVPEQTTFSKSEDHMTSKVLSTSPPQLTIMPSQVKETNCHTSAGGHPSKSVTSGSTGSNRCISETPAVDFITSHTLKPSLAVKDNLLVMSGRVETQSKTDSSFETVEPVRFLTHPSTTFALNSSWIQAQMWLGIHILCGVLRHVSSELTACGECV